MKSELIIACSSGSQANVAISVIRLSGIDFLPKIDRFFSIDMTSLKSHQASFCKIIEGKSIIDEVVVSYFKGPNSYNGEDILEVSCHGNRLNVERILNLFQKTKTARLAKPGEFTERALKNGKISLSQVEGLDMLLNADNVLALEQGMSLLGGELKKDFYKLHSDFKKHKAALELGFDFLDDVGEEGFQKNFDDSLSALEETIKSLHTRAVENSQQLINPEIVLFGPPNAGKSTLFNQLLGLDRAIVSEKAGTTRDFITENLIIDGNQFKLIDTAGLRVTSDEIERLGIEKAKALLEDSFFKILVLDPHKKFNFEEFKNIDFDLCLLTHCRDGVDLDSNYDFLKQSGPIEPLTSAPIGPVRFVDLIEDDVKEILRSHILSRFQDIMNFDPLLLNRHRDKIKSIYKDFQDYKKTASDINDLAIISSEFNTLGHCISELIGIASPDEILDEIFNNFCIGK